MGGLNGCRVALLESRLSSEAAGLVRRYGGLPVCVPAVEERALDAPDDVAGILDWLAENGPHVVVFLTGVGVAALFEQAGRLGRRDWLADQLACALTVCRGPKPTAALRREGVPVRINVPEPYTSVELLASLAEIDLTYSQVAIVHYGERNVPLAAALRARCAGLRELCLYEWRLPDDCSPLEQFIEDLLAGRIDAIAFTAQVQARHLFAVAGRLNTTAELVRALNERVIVGSVGPTCAACLADLGVPAWVVPGHPKLGHLVRSLAEYVEAQSAAGGTPLYRSATGQR